MEKIFDSKTAEQQKMLLLKYFLNGSKKKEGILNNNSIVNILSPGRANIIGEHTDYNSGFSLPFAIDKYKFLTGVKNNSEFIEVYDHSIGECYRFSIKNISFDSNIKWANYIKGVVCEYIIHNHKIDGFSFIIDSNLSIGSGVSSSAAIEVGVAKLIEQLFNLNIKPRDIVEYCHSAENNFVGVKCGYLDQISVVFGKKNCAIFLDFKDLSHNYIPFNLKDYLVLIVDSKEKRNLSSTEYNKRREECNEALELFIKLSGNKEIKNLSEIDLGLLHKFKNIISKELYMRTRHVITENIRVLKTKEALSRGNIQEIGNLLNESHKSLRNDYEVSTEKLDYLVDELNKVNGVLGARLMGAGFGGSIISIVKHADLDKIKDIISEKYLRKYNEIPDFICCRTSDGAKKVIY
ncbi:MAG: galactokinase [Actinomycetota bacterium]|nr:galactokinase [Actinomycetota bacterium]